MQVGAYINLVCDAYEQKAINYVRWMAICGTPSLCIDKLSVLLDMGLQHIYLLGGTPYEGPPGKRITGIVDVAELFATDVMPQIRKDYGAS